MSALPLALCLALAWFVLLDAALSVSIAPVVALGRRRATRRARPWRGNTLLAMRLAPAAVSIAFVVCVFLPGFLAYEPHGRVEPVGGALLALAAIAACLGAAAVRRGLLVRRQAASLVERWQARATRVDLPGAAIEAYAIDDAFPVVSLVGIRRPRLFIARQVLGALSPRELALAVAHEIGHRSAWDNLKRHVLCWTPDLLGFLPAGRQLDRQWALAAECDADAAAVLETPVRGVELAGALIKVSRLTMQPPPVASLFSALHEGGDVTLRVSLLVDAQRQRGTRARWGVRAAAAVAAVAVVGLPQAWSLVHRATELMVHILG